MFPVIWLMSATLGWTIVITAVLVVLAVLVGMNFAKPEKELERKPAHLHTIREPEFQRELSMMMGPSVLSGNRIEALQNGDKIFPAMLEAVQSAQISITFETYIYWSGVIGKEFAEALSERARAGIPVHVLIDWVGSNKMEQSLIQEMDRSGVNIQRYRPLNWYNIRRMNHRTHRKLMVVDGKLAFTGGVGIADQWMGHAQDPDHWRDTHFRIEGPVVAQLQAAFNDNWIKTTGHVCNGPTYFPHLEEVGDMQAQMFIASPTGGRESMHLMYLLAIAAAEKSIDLTASYFVPDRLIQDALLAARKRGIRVRVLLPGKYIDSSLVRISSKASWGELLKAGVEIYEYQPTMLHTKCLIIDQYFISVGSTNFDIRSFRLNDEASLNIYHADFAQELMKKFEEDLQSSKRCDYEIWRRRPLRQKLSEKLIEPIRSQL